MKAITLCNSESFVFGICGLDGCYDIVFLNLNFKFVVVETPSWFNTMWESSIVEQM